MKRNNKSGQLMVLILFLILESACTKSDFLKEKPDQKLIVPNTITDFRLLLDNAPIMNGFGIGLIPGLGEVSADDYFVNQELFNSDLSENPINSRMYTWQDDLFIDPQNKPEDWGYPYRSIFYSNVVLEGLNKISPTANELKSYNELKGEALFFRAHMFYQLMQVFAPYYNGTGSKEGLGIPLRLIADISTKASRPKSEEVYNQIIEDLLKAADYLPDQSTYNTRPSKLAVFALLARVFLTIREFERSLEFAEKCLKIKSDLIDYNTVNNSKFFPFDRNNKEIIFYSVLNFKYLDVLNVYYARIDSSLYSSYSDGDLRKELFFIDANSVFGLPNDPYMCFRGSYDGGDQLFAGIALDEIYFIRAECYARKGNIGDAMENLNFIMKMRWDNKMQFTPYDAQSSNEALSFILIERRKELLMRGLRWTDIRRLNFEGANIIPRRYFNNQEFVLPVNSLHYTLLLPQDVIDLNQGMPQNPR